MNDTDPRLVEIQRQRHSLMQQQQIAELLFENVTFKLEKLQAEEEKIKAEVKTGGKIEKEGS